MARKNRTLNLSELTGGSAMHTRAPIAIRDGSVRLQLPPGEPDLEALRSVTREWLVPRLVEKFLRLHGVELKHSRKFGNLASRLQLSLPGGLSLAGDEPGSGTADPKKLNRRRTRKRNTEP
jgi:hypothetical protein